MNYSNFEERLHGFSHLIGAVGSVVGGIILLSFAFGVEQIISLSVYSLTSLLVYTSSTLYHITKDPILKAKFLEFDYYSIFLMIAGSYTPILILGLPDLDIKWYLIFSIWAVCILGILLRFFFRKKYKPAQLMLYILTGGSAFWFQDLFFQYLGKLEFNLILVGILSYLIGFVFYSYRKKYTHFIWHICVLIGTVLHYCSLLLILGII